MEDDISYNVRKILAHVLGYNIDGIWFDTPLSNFTRDSLDQVECAMALEDEFAIIVDDQEFIRLATVGDVVALVKRHLEMGK